MFALESSRVKRKRKFGPSLGLGSVKTEKLGDERPSKRNLFDSPPSAGQKGESPTISTSNVSGCPGRRTPSITFLDR